MRAVKLCYYFNLERAGKRAGAECQHRLSREYNKNFRVMHKRNKIYMVSQILKAKRPALLIFSWEVYGRQPLSIVWRPSSETQGQLVPGAGKGLNGRGKNSSKEKSRTRGRAAPGSPRISEDEWRSVETWENRRSKLPSVKNPAWIPVSVRLSL